MTAKAKAKRATEVGEPDSGKLPEGTPGEPKPDPEPSDQSNPDEEEDQGDDEPERGAEPVKAPRAPARDDSKTTRDEAPSYVARIFRFWTTDLNGK